MKLFVFLVTVLAMGRGRIISMGSCSADDFGDMEFQDEREDCADGSCGPAAAAAAAASVYAEKRMIVPDKVAEHRQLVPRLQAMSAQNSFSQWRPICECGSQSEVINLGEGHYPMFILMAKCKAKSCASKYHQCRHQRYRVHVLVNRGISSPLNTDELDDVRDLQEVPLPDSLRANWKFFAFSVPVACVAVEKT